MNPVSQGNLHEEALHYACSSQWYGAIEMLRYRGELEPANNAFPLQRAARAFILLDYPLAPRSVRAL